MIQGVQNRPQNEFSTTRKGFCQLKCVWQNPFCHSAILPTASGVLPRTLVLSRLPDESQKLFAMSFGEHLHHDPDALEIDSDDVFMWLGMNRKDSALRLLTWEFSSAEYVSHTDVGSLGTTGGRRRDVYMIFSRLRS